MATARKTELSTLEAIVVEHALGAEARRDARDGALARIQMLTRERQTLYSKSAAHPIYAPTYAPRIRALAAEIDALWDGLRRERATRRVIIERAFNVVGDDDDKQTPAANLDPADLDDLDDAADADTDDLDDADETAAERARPQPERARRQPATRRARSSRATSATPAASAHDATATPRRRASANAANGSSAKTTRKATHAVVA